MEGHRPKCFGLIQVGICERPLEQGRWLSGGFTVQSILRDSGFTLVYENARSKEGRIDDGYQSHL